MKVLISVKDRVPAKKQVYIYSMKNRLTVILILLALQPVQAQYTIELTHWKYSNGLHSKQKRQEIVLEKYDTNGLLLERTSPAYGDSLRDRTLYIYNNKKQKIAEEKYVRTHQLVDKKNFSYNDSGFVQYAWEEHRTKEGQRYKWQEEYFYDAGGRVIKMIETSEGHFPAQVHLYRYAGKDSNQVVTELLSTEGKKKVKKIISTYNSKGLIIKKLHLGFDYMTDSVFRYEYDADGDWAVQQVCERKSRISPWIWTGEYRKTRTPTR